MSKKPNPNAAYSQTLTAEQKEHYNHALVVSADGMTYLFSNAAATVAIVSPMHNFGSFKEFAEKVNTESTLDFFQNLAYNEPASKADRADWVEWQVKLWMQLCKTANNRLSAAKAEGRKTPAKMLNRSYELIKLEVPAELKMPPQAKTCLTFFAEKATAAGHTDDKGVFSIKEEEFKSYVVEQAPRLKTRQDPWRIFQYYRPELIKNGFIRLI